MKKRAYGRVLLLVMWCSVLPVAGMAQESEGENGLSFNGSLQSNMLFPQSDKKTGAQEYSEKLLMNNYLDLNLYNKWFSAGARMEYMEHPMPGYEEDFKGWGLPHLFASVKLGGWQFTAGDFYEQFGSGLILRTYEERSLGIDGALRGGRIAARPFTGVSLKLLGGRQRHYWKYNKAQIWGADLELNLSEWSSLLQEKNINLTLGVSDVVKHEKEETVMADYSHRLNLPVNVNAWDLRAMLQAGNYNFIAEYAGKNNDPTLDNGYIYKKGSALFLSGSYSQEGASLLLQAKRSDNIGFRSRRTITGISSFINNLPAFSMQHTYSLAALYPYTTQPDGEWAFQGELSYYFKRNTTLGGRYGMQVKLHASHIRDIDKQSINPTHPRGTDGYTSSFFKLGDQVYYQDINLTVSKKWSALFKSDFMYSSQRNKKVILDNFDGFVNSHIFVFDGKYQLSKKCTLRGEFQYLTTAQDRGDWVAGLLELSVRPSLMFTLSDMYNAGTTHLHYYYAGITFDKRGHRLQVSYGRTVEGFNCTGGVCRKVPATKGMQISYEYTF